MLTMSRSEARYLRVEEVDAPLVLPQILRLRALAGRCISLAPAVARWLDPRDPHDLRAMHWGVFRGAELVAAARLCLQADVDELPDAALFHGFDVDLPEPVAVMSHCVVDARLRDMGLEGMLDAIRIERARQLRLGAVIAVARSPRRIVALEAQGFDALEPASDGRCGLVLHTVRKPRAQIIRMRVPSRT